MKDSKNVMDLKKQAMTSRTNQNGGASKSKEGGF